MKYFIFYKYYMFISKLYINIRNPTSWQTSLQKSTTIFNKDILLQKLECARKNLLYTCEVIIIILEVDNKKIFERIN